jgi:hypothetical protein
MVQKRKEIVTRRMQRREKLLPGEKPFVKKTLEKFHHMNGFFRLNFVYIKTLDAHDELNNIIERKNAD